MPLDADVIVVGGGIAGLVAATELADKRRRVLLLDQEPEQSLGGQAFWSFGGMFLVNSPEQRRLGVKDSHDLALQDWMGSAAFDRPEDFWPCRWAEAYVAWAAGEKRSWLRKQGIRFFPVVSWAERGGYLATEHGNSAPRFHIPWGTGPAIVEPFVRRAREAEEKGLLSFRFRHRVTALTTTNGAVDGVHGEVLEPTNILRGQASSRLTVGEFELRAQAVVVTSGGIGGNSELVRKHWPARLGKPPTYMLNGTPAHVDGHMLEVSEAAGASLINRDRMWHYNEGIRNWNPIWPNHGIRILPGPSSVWLDAQGDRLPPPLFPGFDTLGTLSHLTKTGFSHSWFILTEKIISREFALSGSEQNPELSNRSWGRIVARAIGLRSRTSPVEMFKTRGADFIVEHSLKDLVYRMNALAQDPLIDLPHLRGVIEARDREINNQFAKDAQVIAIRSARRYLGDRLFRTAPPHRILDPLAGPLIAVRLSTLTRKTLGGLETDLESRVLKGGGEPIPGFYAAGEVAGFGGGGMHGYRALEGTFLGGCLFSGRTAGRAAAADVI